MDIVAFLKYTQDVTNVYSRNNFGEYLKIFQYYDEMVTQYDLTKKEIPILLLVEKQTGEASFLYLENKYYIIINLNYFFKFNDIYKSVLKGEFTSDLFETIKSIYFKDEVFEDLKILFKNKKLFENE